jgi:hypothetical protein
MRILDVPAESAVAELLELAELEEIVLRLPNGKVFLLMALADDEAATDDFAYEIARTRQNAALMHMLRERSDEETRYSAQQVRERLGLQP